MPRPYCGGKVSAPRGRQHASTETACSRQVRAFGRRLARGQGREEAGRALLGMEAPRGRRCGSRSPDAVQESCPRQVRRYGLLPVIEARTDLTRRSFLARTAPEYAALPRVPTPRHPYTATTLEGRNATTRGGTLVFVSVLWSGLGEDAEGVAASPTTERGAVGFAFGYFGGRKGHGGVRHFNVVHVHVNPAYRKGPPGYASTLSSWALEQLTRSVQQRGRELYGPGVAMVVRIDPNAPCFQMGNAEFMTAPKSQQLEDMYAGAGFSIVPLPAEGARRRTAELHTVT